MTACGLAVELEAEAFQNLDDVAVSKAGKSAHLYSDNKRIIKVFR